MLICSKIYVYQTKHIFIRVGLRTNKTPLHSLKVTFSCAKGIVGPYFLRMKEITALTSKRYVNMLKIWFQQELQQDGAKCHGFKDVLWQLFSGRLISNVPEVMGLNTL